MTQEHVSEALKELVITRIEAQTPNNVKLSIGSSGTFNKEELIDHIRKEDAIGKQVIQSHLSFLQAIASGKVTRALTGIEQ